MKITLESKQKYDSLVKKAGQSIARELTKGLPPTGSFCRLTIDEAIARHCPKRRRSKTMSRIVSTLMHSRYASVGIECEHARDSQHPFRFAEYAERAFFNDVYRATYDALEVSGHRKQFG